MPGTLLWDVIIGAEDGKPLHEHVMHVDVVLVKALNPVLTDVPLQAQCLDGVCDGAQLAIGCVGCCLR